MLGVPRSCDAHLDLFNFKYALPHLTEGLKRQRKIKIVAIGSSSTAGEADIVPYPSRLEMLLRGRFHDRMIDVLNRGIGGQEAPSELSRFEPDVFAEEPALVIWQVGTNAVFRKEEFNFEDVAGAIATGLRWLADLPIDMVLMDLQYATAVVEPKATLALSEDLVARISAAAGNAGVDVFRQLRSYALLGRARQNSDQEIGPPGRPEQTPHERLGDQLHHGRVVPLDRAGRGSGRRHVRLRGNGNR
jgi:hypothetical protein